MYLEIGLLSSLNRLSEAVWRKLGINQNEFCQFIKLYLSIEEWFHSKNPKKEVRGSRKLIAKILRLLKKVFQERLEMITTFPNSTV